MVEGMVQNPNGLIPIGHDWSPLFVWYFNISSQTEPTHRDMIYRHTNPLASIGVNVMCSGPQLWLGYLLIVYLW